ncbi:DUF3037 domain-containing protein [Lapillicoccus sp.]|uniref:DUF3037 domain-containing protein n=1 Tax=Lapillicoccus sp. TaxID=1909287 RepID=UPI00326492A0
MIGYQHVTLRCVPRVGAPARLRSLDSRLDVAMVDDMLCAVQAVCRGDEGRGLPHLEGLGRRFGWLSAPRSTIIQPGPRHGGLCSDPGVELSCLMEVLVRSS